MTCYYDDTGSILAAKSKSDEHLKEAKKEAKRIIHAFHKARDSKVSLEVNSNLNVHFYHKKIS